MPRVRLPATSLRGLSEALGKYVPGRLGRLPGGDELLDAQREGLLMGEQRLHAVLELAARGGLAAELRLDRHGVLPRRGEVALEVDALVVGLPEGDLVAGV